MRIRTIAWTALVVVMTAAAVAGGLAWHQGYRLYAVRTGSMTPTYSTGSLVIDRPVRSSPSPAVGDVITFRTQDGLVTHRVHDLTPQGIKTKGDANRVEDPWTLPARDVVGHVVAGIPDGGYVLVFLKQPTGVPALMLMMVSVALAWNIFFGTSQSAEPGDERRRGNGLVARPA